MKKEQIAELQSRFEAIARKEQDVEFWLARYLQPLLGYTEWRNFEAVLDKARTACANPGQRVPDHSVDVNKMVDPGSGARPAITTARDGGRR